MTVCNQFTTDLRRAQRELEQTRDAINAATARARHAIKRVRHTAHTAIECSPGILVSCIAVSAADVDAQPVKSFDCLESSGQFGRDRYTFDQVGMSEQLLHRRGRWVLNELSTLRAGFRSRNERPFHMHTADQPDR